MPLFGIAGDTQAQQTFAEALPGYEVIGFPWGNWYYYDALHCRVRAVFDRHMLRITHRRMDEEVVAAPAYPVVAFIDDRSEAGLVADELRVYWRAQGEAVWDWELLTPTGDSDAYGAEIPAQVPGTTVEYYIAAVDHSGRSESLPRSAPAGFYSFIVLGTSAVPAVSTWGVVVMTLLTLTAGTIVYALRFPGGQAPQPTSNPSDTATRSAWLRAAARRRMKITFTQPMLRSQTHYLIYGRERLRA